jgi:hypothetical protein
LSNSYEGLSLVLSTSKLTIIINDMPVVAGMSGKGQMRGDGVYQADREGQGNIACSDK